MKLDLKITPYKAKVLYSEYKMLIDRKKSLSEFVMKTDILALKRHFPKLALEDVLKACIDTFSLIGKMYEKSNNFIQNYLSGIGTIADCNDLCKENNLISLQDLILRQEFGNSYIMNYLYYSIVNNYKEREKLISQEMQQEIIKMNNKNNRSLEAVIDSVNSKLSDIQNLIQTISNKDTELHIEELTLEKIEKINDSLEALAKDRDSANNRIVSKIHSYSDFIDKLSKSLEKTKIESQNSYIQTFNELKSIEHGLRSLNMNVGEINSTVKSGNEELNNKINSLTSYVEALREYLQSNIGNDFSNMIANLETLRRSLENTKDSVNNQVMATKEIEDMLLKLVNGTAIIKSALDNLNNVMRVDLIETLLKGSDNVLQTDRSVSALERKYDEIRGGRN